MEEDYKKQDIGTGMSGTGIRELLKVETVVHKNVTCNTQANSSAFSRTKIKCIKTC